MGQFVTFAIYNPDNLDKLEKAIKEEFTKILKEGVTADELKAAKSGYMQNRQVDRTDDQNLIYQLNNNLWLNRTFSFQAQQDKIIENLSVAQVNEALRKYVQPEKFVVVKAGDFDKTTTSGSGAKKAF